MMYFANDRIAEAYARMFHIPFEKPKDPSSKDATINWDYHDNMNWKPVHIMNSDPVVG